MSYHETQYPDLLGGVSQQSPTERSPNAVSEQINMVSDPVLGLRRRSPFEFIREFVRRSNSDQNNSNEVFLRTRLRGREVIVMVARDTGTVTCYDAETGDSIDVSNNPDTRAYLQATDIDSYKVTSLGDVFYVMNTEQSPSEEPVSTGDIDPRDSGYIYVVRGALSTKYSVRVRNLDNGQFVEGEYETPDGTAEGDAYLASPGNIAAELMISLASDINDKGYSWVSTGGGGGPYQARSTQSLFFTAPSEITSEQDNTLLRTSGAGTVRSANELPQSLPDNMDSYRIGIEQGLYKQYFRYDADSASWIEDAAYAALARVENICVQFTVAFSQLPGEEPELFMFASMLHSQRRPAGDDDSNPAFRLVGDVTGISSFKGRLVVLAGDFVCMSASNQPDVWYRSTLAEVLDNDPIEIAETATKSAPYTYGVGFAGGLLLTASTHQAFIPGGAAVTPSTATLSTLSEYSQRDDVPPELMGSALLLPFNRNNATASDGLYYAALRDNEQPVLVANDLTQVVPNYIGRIHHMALSTSAGMLAVADNSNRMVVFQFTSEDSDSALAAWHSWELPNNSSVRDIYFMDSYLYAVVAVQRETTEPDLHYMLVRAEISNGLEPTHFLDYYFTRSTLTNQLTTSLPEGYPSDLWPPGIFYGWFCTDGEFQQLGGQADFETLAFTDGIPKTGAFTYGVPFESSVSPSPPIVRDRSEYALRKERVNLVKFRVHLENTGLIQADVFDRVYTFTVPDLSPVGIYMPEQVGQGPLSGDGYVTIPCRTDAKHTQLTLRTNDFYDMNIKAVEYGFKVQPKHRRA